MDQIPETPTPPQDAARVASTPESENAMSLTQLREKFKENQELTPGQVTDGVLELNRIADEQISDAGGYIREMRENYRVGLLVALEGGDEKVVGFMTTGYRTMEDQTIMQKLHEKSTSEPESPQAPEQPHPIGFTQPQATTESTPTPEPTQ